ncbi:hypothetical protein B0J14DRAFT_553190 [Halenospora varia]|nr:hypothetical protein B0J14DRAFT_553190 [Halenospora varia]
MRASRRQFSSCDACRQSRVACDASKLGHQPGQTDWGGSCSRCLSWNRKCTFAWIKKSPSRLRKDKNSRSVPAVAESLVSYQSSDHAVVEQPPNSQRNSADTSSSNAGSVDVLLTRWCDQIFNSGFGTIFSRWVGRHGCPFVNDQTSDISIAPMKLFRELDTYLKQLDGSLVSALEALSQRDESNSQIEQSLRRAMLSFAAQWLPAVMQGTPSSPIRYEELIKERWRASRRDMLKVVNRTSYRSVLTLYLFGQTPVPLGISEEEEMDGISSVVCTQTALLQLQLLRERVRSCQFSSSGVPPWSSRVAGSTANPNLTQAFLDLENRAYWAAVTWDTSSSMTLTIRSSLTSGLKGACLEPAWRLARGFLVGSFHARSEDWRKKDFEVSDEIAFQIMSAAEVCRVYTWKTIASVKEALREGVEESDTLFSWNAFLDALDVFKTTIHPLLSACERRLHFLVQLERLNWYEVVLHYHLGILILADALETANCLYLLSQLTEAMLVAEQESFNVLKFGLESKYTIFGPREESCNALDVNVIAHSTGPSITTSFVAIDPYPDHVVVLVRLIKKAISRKYRQGNIKHEAYSYLSSTLLKALEQLPQSSKMVQSVQENLQESLELDAISLV